MNSPNEMPISGRARRWALVLKLTAGTALGTALVWLATPASPLFDHRPQRHQQTATDVRVTPPPTPAPAELVRFAQLDVRRQVLAPAAPEAAEPQPEPQPQIGREPAPDVPDFVPVPVAPVPTPFSVAEWAPPAPTDNVVDLTADRARDTVAQIDAGKLDVALQQALEADADTPVRVIMRTRDGDAGATAAWLNAEGRTVHKMHPSIGGLTATLSASDVAVLSTDPAVAAMSIDAVVRPTAEPTSGAVIRETLGLAGGGGRDGSGGFGGQPCQPNHLPSFYNNNNF